MGDFRTMDFQQHINKNFDFFPRRAIDRESCRYQDFRREIHKNTFIEKMTSLPKLPDVRRKPSDTNYQTIKRDKIKGFQSKFQYFPR